jgi:hypothetical protein
MKTLVFVLVVVPIGIVISPLVAILSGVSSFFMSFLTYWHGISTSYWKAKPSTEHDVVHQETQDVWAKHVERMNEKNKLN